MNLKHLSLVFLCAAFICTSSALVRAQAVGQIFTVRSTDDSTDATPGDDICADESGRCTLRAAIQEANSNPDTRDAILFAVASPVTIDLTLGELVITGGVYIVYHYSYGLTVQRSFADGTPAFRLFRITAAAGPVTIRGLTLRNGDASTGSGGAIAIEGQSTVTLTAVRISDNRAGNGGAISNAGTVKLDRSLLTANNATLTNGGAVDNYTTTAIFTATNSTFYQNTAASQGGAIRNIGTTTLINTTFLNNAAARCETMCTLGPANVINTIFGTDVGPASSLEGAFTSLGNNIVVDATLATGFVNGQNYDQVSDASHTIDPKLGPLANNGGDIYTIGLLDGSPAINSGNNCVFVGNCPNLGSFPVISDQRSRHTRQVAGTVDIGSFEFGAGYSHSSTSFGIGSIGGRPARYLGTFGVLTDTFTTESIHSPMNQFGYVNFTELPSDVYIFQMRSKRSITPLSLISFDDGMPFSKPEPEGGLVFKFKQTSNK
jgi:CSLREA domain-containing protein